MNSNKGGEIDRDLGKTTKLQTIVKKGPKFEEVINNAHRYIAEAVQRKLKTR